jgi:hypothetical protein
MTKIVVAFRNFAKAPKTKCWNLREAQTNLHLVLLDISAQEKDRRAMTWKHDNYERDCACTNEFSFLFEDIDVVILKTSRTI